MGGIRIDEVRQAIAKNLRELRGDKSQSEVSAATGIGISALNNYEAGLRLPRYAAMTALAYYYKKPVDEIFFTGDDTIRDILQHDMATTE